MQGANLIAMKSFKYDGKSLKIGDHFRSVNDRDTKILVGIKRAMLDPIDRGPSAVVVPVAPTVAALESTTESEVLSSEDVGRAEELAGSEDPVENSPTASTAVPSTFAGRDGNYQQTRRGRGRKGSRGDAS